jgi:threonine synthase
MAPSANNLRINPNVRRLACSSSGKDVDSHGFERPIGLCTCCPEPGMPVLVEYDLDAVRSELEGAPGFGPSESGLGAFSPLLPVIDWPADYAADVGHTPVVAHSSLSAEIGVEVSIKNEGTNPSGSFKDRGLAVAVALGRACGARRFCLPTQGNAGVAASLFSARLDLPGSLVYMPEGYQESVYHRAAALFGAESIFIGANIAAAGRTMRDDLADRIASGEIVDLSTFFEPGRLEGKKTMGLEIAQQVGGSRLPDFILYATGGTKAWVRLEEGNVLDVVPGSQVKLVG